ncbi:MAG: nitrate reductase molybdenum cofactor assembly chaperone [Alphaproteobacteria bacterium]|jgi:nitrate reductase delta subunit|nr:nitrate reductase molybdenum cofactor assembly chaperone [Alphaproteobacteria bacterium]
MQSFAVLSALLRYPEPELWDHLGEIPEVLAADGLVPGPERREVEAFIACLADTDPMAAQSLHIDLFDCGRALSLHLFEHIHGESRDRGQAMVDLADHYRACGLEPDPAELPDYLPLFLEFLSTRPAGEARELLGEAVDVIALLGKRLERRESPYRLLFPALLALAARRPNETWVRDGLEKGPQGAPDPARAEAEEAAEWDAAWEEPAVTFGGTPAGPDTACPKAADLLQRMTAGR